VLPGSLRLHGNKRRPAWATSPARGRGAVGQRRPRGPRRPRLRDVLPVAFGTKRRGLFGANARSGGGVPGGLVAVAGTGCREPRGMSSARWGGRRASRSRALTRACRRGPVCLATPNRQGVFLRLRDMPLPAPGTPRHLVHRRRGTACLPAAVPLLPGSLWLCGNKRCSRANGAASGAPAVLGGGNSLHSARVRRRPTGLLRADGRRVQSS
jgi:hypothetical protein